MGWGDPEWPQTCKNALAHLWARYEETTEARISDRIASGKLVEQLNEEKKQLDRRYSTLLNEMGQMNKFLEKTVKEAEKAEYDKIMNQPEDLQEVTRQRDWLEKEVKALKEKLGEAKKLQTCQGEMISGFKKQMAEEKEAWQKEKMKLEEVILKQFKAADANKVKLHAIKDLVNGP